MKNRVMLAGVAVLMAGTAAQSQTTGHFRVEGLGGWDDVVLHAKYTDFTTGERFGARDSKSGATYGVGGGFDFETTSGFVFGPAASLMWSSTRTCGEVLGDDRACLKAGRDIEAGARLGQRYSSRGALAYVKLAYVNDRVKASYDDGVDRVSAHDDRGGVRVGVGLEQPVGSRFYVKAEYRYTDLKDYKLAEDEESLRLGFERHQVVGGVGVHF